MSSFSHASVGPKSAYRSRIIPSARATTPGINCRLPGRSRFHIMRHVVDAIDKVRKQEHKALLKVGDETLSRSKSLWLTNPENMKAPSRERFESRAILCHDTDCCVRADAAVGSRGPQQPCAIC